VSSRRPQPEQDEPQGSTFRTGGSLLVEVGGCMLPALLGSMGWFDSRPNMTAPRNAVSYAVLMGCCALAAVLIGRQRVRLEGETVVVQNALIRRRLAVADIQSVRATNYSGMLNEYSASMLLHILQITMRDGAQ